MPLVQPQVRILENWFMRGTFYALYAPCPAPPQLARLPACSPTRPPARPTPAGFPCAWYPSVGFFSIDLDIDESTAGIVQGSVALLIVACGLLYSLMVRAARLRALVVPELPCRTCRAPQGLTCQKRVKELMAVEHKMMKRGLLGAAAPQQRPYEPVPAQPPR